MKLRTKFQDEDFELGEVVDANIYYGSGGRIKVIAEPTRGGMITFYFETLKGMNKMFEDYEEPKEHYFITEYGEVFSLNEYEGLNNVANVEDYKTIGNYFETKEEAEKAVEKLKAWKRLKDARFEFGTIKYNLDEESSSTIAYDGTITIKGMAYEDFVDDLDLLFGGEE